MWVFDIDGTLIDSLTGTSLRPLALAVLEALRAREVEILFWSAAGGDYARQRSAEHGFEHFALGFHDKAFRGIDGRWASPHPEDPVRRLVFVDDRPEDTPSTGLLLAVRPYVGHNPRDRGLAHVLALATGNLGDSPGTQ